MLELVRNYRFALLTYVEDRSPFFRSQTSRWAKRFDASLDVLPTTIATKQEAGAGSTTGCVGSASPSITDLPLQSLHHPARAVCICRAPQSPPANHSACDKRAPG